MKIKNNDGKTVEEILNEPKPDPELSENHQPSDTSDDDEDNEDNEDDRDEDDNDDDNNNGDQDGDDDRDDDEDKQEEEEEEETHGFTRHSIHHMTKRYKGFMILFNIPAKK